MRTEKKRAKVGSMEPSFTCKTLQGKQSKPYKATQLKLLPQRVFIGGVHGKNPGGTAAVEAMAPYESFCLEAGGERLDHEESQLFTRSKAKSPGGVAPWCVDISKYLTDFSNMKKPSAHFFLEVFVFACTSDLSHCRQPPAMAPVIVWALKV